MLNKNSIQGIFPLDLFKVDMSTSSYTRCFSMCPSHDSCLNMSEKIIINYKLVEIGSYSASIYCAIWWFFCCLPLTRIPSCDPSYTPVSLPPGSDISMQVPLVNTLFVFVCAQFYLACVI